MLYYVQGKEQTIANLFGPFVSLFFPLLSYASPTPVPIDRFRVSDFHAWLFHLSTQYTCTIGHDRVCDLGGVCISAELNAITFDTSFWKSAISHSHFMKRKSDVAFEIVQILRGRSVSDDLSTFP